MGLGLEGQTASLTAAGRGLGRAIASLRRRTMECASKVSAAAPVSPRTGHAWRVI